mmetsp:Transcript_17497/g.38002  ORF Transcript_17497/g.38002 Transcript_17497/m.38002 type:complete len:98 (+) Transcript_17497:17-310(+)
MDANCVLRWGVGGVVCEGMSDEKGESGHAAVVDGPAPSESRRLVGKSVRLKRNDLRWENFDQREKDAVSMCVTNAALRGAFGATAGFCVIALVATRP